MQPAVVAAELRFRLNEIFFITQAEARKKICAPVFFVEAQIDWNCLILFKDNWKDRRKAEKRWAGLFNHGL